MKNKKAYTLIQLLLTLIFVSIIFKMAVISVLQPNLNLDSSLRIKEHIKQFIKFENDIFLKTSQYETVDTTVIDKYPNNILKTKENNISFGFLEDSTIQVVKIDCEDDTKGINMAVIYKNNSYKYNSCTDLRIN